MKLIRNGIVVAAVGALMVLPVATAHAAPPTPQTLKVSSFDGATSQGWGIDDNGKGGEAYPYEFVAVAGNTPPIGTGGLQFVAPTETTVRPEEKMFIRHEERISAGDFRRVRFEYYFAPNSGVKDPAQIYLILYVKTATPVPSPVRDWYDCKLTYPATEPPTVSGVRSR